MEDVAYLLSQERNLRQHALQEARQALGPDASGAKVRKEAEAILAFLMGPNTVESLTASAKADDAGDATG